MYIWDSGWTMFLTNSYEFLSDVLLHIMFRGQMDVWGFSCPAMIIVIIIIIINNNNNNNNNMTAFVKHKTYQRHQCTVKAQNMAKNKTNVTSYKQFCTDVPSTVL